MAIITPFEYYNDPINHGNYQYVSIRNIVDDLLLEAEQEDSGLKNIKRYFLIKLIREAISDITKYLQNEILAIEMTVPDSLNFPLPQDYVNWARVSLVILDQNTGSKRLVPLDINTEINTSVGFLQDNFGNILFDNDGYILTSDSDNAFGKPYKKEFFIESGGQFNLNTAKLSQYGEFKIDKRRGVILFSSELSDKEVVLEYVSDGLQADINEDEVTVLKDIVKCVKDHVYYMSIERNRNIPANEKERARRKYRTSRHEVMLNTSGINLIQISRDLRAKGL